MSITGIYIRVSTADQAAGLAAQEEICLKYADLRELPTPSLYVDIGVSGSTPLQDRPQGAVLFDDIEEGRIDAVLAVRLDRLFRDVSDTLNTITRWDEYSVALHLVDMGGAAVDTSSAVGRLMITMLAGMAEFERRLIAERTAAAKASQKARGLYLGGTVPWGYRLEDGKLYPSPMERMTVDIATAERGRGKTWREIAAQLNGRDLKNRGRDWRPDTLVRRIGKYKPEKTVPIEKESAA